MFLEVFDVVFCFSYFLFEALFFLYVCALDVLMCLFVRERPFSCLYGLFVV